MKLRRQHIKALLFGILLGGLGPGSLFFVTTDGWISWITASLMTIGVASVSVGFSLSLTNERKNNQGNFWGVLTEMVGLGLMAFATGVYLYIQTK